MEITEEKLVYVQEVTDKLLLEGIKEKIKALQKIKMGIKIHLDWK